MAVALEWFWARHGGLTEGRGWLEATLERVADHGLLRAKGLVALGSILEFAGDYERADARLEEGLTLHQGLGDLHGVAAAWSGMGTVAYHRGDLSRSRYQHEEALALYRDLGDPWGAGRALYGLGVVEMMQGDLQGAAALFEDSGALFREVGDHWSVASTGMHLAGVAFLQGEHKRAIELYRPTVTLSQGLGDVVLAGRSLTGLAFAVGAAGEPHRAARLWAAARALPASAITANTLIHRCFPLFMRYLLFGTGRLTFWDHSAPESVSCPPRLRRVTPNLGKTPSGPGN